MFVGMDVSNDGQPTCAMIEDQHGVRDHENHVRQAEFVLFWCGQ
jgi:hypothetical protein